MTTETRLIATCRQARELAGMLTLAADEAEGDGEVRHVRTVLEQSDDNGPWRLVIHVVAPEETDET